MRTSLWWSEVFAWCWRARPSTACFLDTECATLVHLALQSVLGRVRLFRRHHLHEPETTTLASVWVSHDVALLNRAIGLEELGHIFFGEAWVDACDEEVRAGIRCVLVGAVLRWWWVTV